MDTKSQLDNASCHIHTQLQLYGTCTDVTYGELGPLLARGGGVMKVFGLVGDRLLVLFRLSLDFLYLSRYRGSVYGVTLTIIDLTIGLRERMTVDKMINLDILHIPHISHIS